MKPYLAVIRDSFDEALASRVLWVLLGGIVVVLLALAPFTWRQTAALEIQPTDIRNIERLAERLKEGSNSPSTSLAAYLWQGLSADTREQLKQIEPNERRIYRMLRPVAQDLSDMIAREDFFRPELWSDIELGKRLQSLVDQSGRSTDETRQMNRLLLEVALPGELEAAPETAVSFYYGPWSLELIPTLSRSMAESALESVMLGFITFFLGMVGIFIAILVTAPIIPNMLESGSLHALLSKPISRPLLYLAKFTGGCSFVLISGGVLVFGLYLILGIRFGLWKPALLWSIPIFLFSFATFYSVSALAGLLWRSAVMAIVATILFWFLCFSVRTTHSLISELVIAPNQLDRVLLTDDEIFGLRSDGDLVRWNAGQSFWEAIFIKPGARNFGPPGMRPRSQLLGPIYDAEQDQLIAMEPAWPQPRIVTGKREEGWVRVDSAAGPRNTQAFFAAEPSPLVVADGGIYRMRTDFQESQQRTSVLGFDLPTGDEPAAVKISSGTEPLLRGDMQAAYDSLRDEMVIATESGDVTVLRRDAGQDNFQIVGTRSIEIAQQLGGIAMAGGHVLLVNRNGQAEWYSTDDLQPLDLPVPTTRAFPQQVVASDSSQWFGVRFDTDHVWLCHPQQPQVRRGVPGVSDPQSIQFSGDELVVTDSLANVSMIDFDDDRRRSLRPQGTLMVQVYRWVVNPLYTVVPKPGELENTARYALTGESTASMPGLGPRDNEPTVRLNPWRPIISNSMFIAVLLAIGCWEMHRRDF